MFWKSQCSSHLNPYVASLLIIGFLAAYGLYVNRNFRIRALGIAFESDRDIVIPRGEALHFKSEKPSALINKSEEQYGGAPSGSQDEKSSCD